MATLRYAHAVMLPPPKLPIRKKLADTSGALLMLGFNADFDLRMECKADGIQAEEVTAGSRFKEALRNAKARRRLLDLPCAHLRLRKGLREDGYPLCDDTPDRLKDAVAKVLGPPHGVKATDVSVAITDGYLECTVEVWTGASVFGIRDTLASQTQDRGGGLERGDPSGIHTAFYEAGGSDDLSLDIRVHMAWEKALMEVRLAGPTIQADLLRKGSLQEVVLTSVRAYDEAWTEAALVERTEAAAILARPSLARFGGELHPADERRSWGQRSEAWSQDASNLPQLMQDAAIAHQMLKEKLAPETDWSRANVNDLRGIPPYAQSRIWTSDSWSLAPSATHVDPGLKSERHCFTKAKVKQRPEQAQPPFYDVTPSRIRVVFKTLKDLNAGLAQIMTTMDVAWMENHFVNPTPLGLRYVDLGVQFQVSRTSRHISRLHLHIQSLHTVKTGTADGQYKALRFMLSQTHLRGRDLDEMVRRVIGTVASTSGMARERKEAELQTAVACVNAKGADNLAVAQQFLQEVAAQAIRAGNSQERVAEILNSTMPLRAG
mmetsp:Transcript_9517/g.21243  ORF Transcript_9517/g.21243 Transcript_9517/m.21243 type:complete len:548 (+) Transcript_9517:95-1738(+)